MWNRIIALIWKELLAVLRDPKSRYSIFIPPLIQLFIFTFAATLDVKNVPIGILNQDSGKESIRTDSAATWLSDVSSSHFFARSSRDCSADR